MGYGTGKNAIARWRAAEVEVLNQICREHGIEPLSPEKSRGTIELPEYKEKRRQADVLAQQNAQAEYQLMLKQTKLSRTETELAEQQKFLDDTQKQVREATADLIKQVHKLEDSEAELSEVKEKVDKTQQKLDDRTARIEKILDYLPNITRDEKLENEYLALSSKLKELMKSSMSIIRNRDEIINVTDDLRTVVKKSVDEAYKAAYAVYDHREYSANKQQELDDALERLKEVRSEKSNLYSELQTVKAENRRLCEVHLMLEKIAPSTMERAKQLVQEQKEQRQREQQRQAEYQHTKKKKSWGLE